MEKLLKIISYVLLLLDLILLPGVPVYAAPAVRAFDMKGKELSITDEHITASSDVEFRLDTTVLNENEIYVCYPIDASGGRGMIEPLEEGVFLMEEGEGGKSVCFNILDETHGSLKEIGGGKISVSFIDGMEAEADLKFEYDTVRETNGIVYLTGAAPVLKVSPVNGVDTFISVSDTKENKKYEIREADTRMAFPEGSYGLTVYLTDGWGRIRQAALPFKQFIYDNTPPSVPEIKVSSEGQGRRSDGRLFFNGNVELTPTASDSLSGIDRYIFRFSGSEHTAGTSLVLEPPLEEELEIFAVDRAGNISEPLRPGEEFILDDAAPKLTSYRIDAGASKCTVHLEYTDGFSGMRKIRVSAEDKTYYSKEFGGRNLNKLVSEFDVELKELESGKNSFKAELTDNSGNTSEYGFSIEKNLSEAPKLSVEGCTEGQIFTQVPVRINIGIAASEGTAVDQRITAVRKNENGAVEWQKTLDPGGNSFNEEGYYVLEIVAADSEGNTSRLIRHFTIDTEAPFIAPLDEFNKKILSSFAFNGDPMNAISDYSHVDYDVFLNGREYDGSSIEEPGKYVLKLVATDELGRSSSRMAEFMISSNEVKTGKDEITYIISENNMKLRTAAPGPRRTKEKTKAKHKDKEEMVNITLEKENEPEQAAENKGIIERIAGFFKELFARR